MGEKYHNYCNCQKYYKSIKLVKRKEYKNKEKVCNPNIAHIGYINLFPLFFDDFTKGNIGVLLKY